MGPPLRSSGPGFESLSAMVVVDSITAGKRRSPAAQPTSWLAGCSTAVDMTVPAAYFSGNSGVTGETRKTGARHEHC